MMCSLRPATNRCPCRNPRPIDQQTEQSLRKTNHRTILPKPDHPFATLSRGDPARFNNPPHKVARPGGILFLCACLSYGPSPQPWKVTNPAHSIISFSRAGMREVPSLCYSRFPAIGIILMASRPSWQRLSFKKTRLAI